MYQYLGRFFFVSSCIFVLFIVYYKIAAIFQQSFISALKTVQNVLWHEMIRI